MREFFLGLGAILKLRKTFRGGGGRPDLTKSYVGGGGCHEKTYVRKKFLYYNEYAIEIFFSIELTEKSGLLVNCLLKCYGPQKSQPWKR